MVQVGSNNFKKNSRIVWKMLGLYFKPYNRSQILQYVTYTKWITIAKDMTILLANIVFFYQIVHHINNKTKGKHKNISKAGSQIRDLSHRSLMRNLYTTESTELMNSNY